MLPRAYQEQHETSQKELPYFVMIMLREKIIHWARESEVTW